jgi:hypothetical protein
MWLARFWRPGFFHPIQPSPRTAVLVPLFREGRRAVYFDQKHPERLARWMPQIVAGYLSQLMAIDASPTHAVVILTHPGEILTDADRDCLWNRFRVPLFQQIIDIRGRLIAYECEAHGPLHVVSETAAQQLGAMRNRLCACGKQTNLLDSEVLVIRPSDRDELAVAG